MVDSGTDTGAGVVDEQRVMETLSKHDERIRSVEQSLEAVPRIETKIDQLLEAGPVEKMAVYRERLGSQQDTIESLEDELDDEVEKREETIDALEREYSERTDELEERLDELAKKVWRSAVIAALVIGVLHGLGVVDLTGLIVV